MNKTTLYLTDDLQRALKDVARRLGRSQADVVREALETYVLQQQPRPLPRSLGAGSDPDLSAADSEAWLRANWRRD
jgi:plasmid stability protein